MNKKLEKVLHNTLSPIPQLINKMNNKIKEDSNMRNFKIVAIATAGAVAFATYKILKGKSNDNDCRDIIIRTTIESKVRIYNKETTEEMIKELLDDNEVHEVIDILFTEEEGKEVIQTINEQLERLGYETI